MWEAMEIRVALDNSDNEDQEEEDEEEDDVGNSFESDDN